MTDAPSIYGFSAHHDRALTLCRQSFGSCPFGCAKDGNKTCATIAQGDSKTLSPCKPGRISNRPFTDFDPVQYCRYILENNPLDSRHIVYFSGEQEPRNLKHGLPKEVWAVAWRTANEIMIESKEHWTPHGTRPLWTGKPSDYSPEVWNQYQKEIKPDAATT